MRKRDLQALAAYVDECAHRLGLCDWETRVEREPADDDCNAQTHLVYGRKLARLRFAADVCSAPPESLRQTVAHELIHCHLEAARSMVDLDLTTHLGKQTAEVFYEGFLRQLEYGIDGLAVAVATGLPLIEWPN